MSNKIDTHTNKTRNSDRKTAAEPMSFALPLSSFQSSPIRSTTASIAEFSNSTITTNNKLTIIIIRSILLTGSMNATIEKIIHNVTSCRNAASNNQADLNPFNEYPAAFITLRTPVVFGFTLTSL
tara:strand:+ start:88 stop:462 length:375 start_codon:yes stop_codon:yes gene_type:complete